MENEKPLWEQNFERDHADKVAEVKIEKKAESKSEELPEEPDKKTIEPEKEKEDLDVEKPDSPEAEPEVKEDDKPAKEEAVPEDDKEPAKEQPPLTDEQVAQYATEKGLSTADAKDELEKLNAIIEKYGKDPLKLAAAYRSTQSAYDKAKSEKEKQVSHEQMQAANAILVNPKAYVEQHINANPDAKVKLIEEYRREYPATSESLTDEAVLEIVKDKAIAQVTGQAKEFQIQMKKDAMAKRDELIASLSSSEKYLLPDVKAVLDKLPDHQVISPNFKFKDLIQYARGEERNFSKAIKEAEERGRKAVEHREIVGEVKRPATTQGKSKAKQPVKAVSSLSAYEQTRAKAMFATAPMTDDEKYEAYIEVTQKKK